jgi:hypothetical protein
MYDEQRGAEKAGNTSGNCLLKHRPIQNINDVYARISSSDARTSGGDWLEIFLFKSELEALRLQMIEASRFEPECATQDLPQRSLNSGCKVAVPARANPECGLLACPIEDAVTDAVYLLGCRAR